MCIVAGDAPSIAAVRIAVFIAGGIERTHQVERTIEIGKEAGDVERFWVKKTWGITLTRRGYKLRWFPRRCAWLLFWRSLGVSVERKPTMMKFVVSFVVAGRDSSISETDPLGKEIEDVFFDFQIEQGGER